jgi:hypothetical protein
MMDVTLLVKSLESGQFEASVLELPAYRVEADSRELAIAGLKNALLNQVKNAEVVLLSLPISAKRSSEGTAVLSSDRNPWKNLFGIFRDDVHFQEVVEIIQAERDALGDEDIDPAYYISQK